MLIIDAHPVTDSEFRFTTYMISLFASQLIGVFLEAIFYGIYLVAFGACLLPKTFSDHGPGRLRLPLWRLPLVIAWVTIALFVLSTAHFGVGLAEVLRTPRDQKTISQRNWVNTTKVCFNFCCCLSNASSLSGHAVFCARTVRR